jgi:hypothetical protein
LYSSILPTFDPPKRVHNQHKASAITGLVGASNVMEFLGEMTDQLHVKANVDGRRVRAEEVGVGEGAQLGDERGAFG